MAFIFAVEKPAVVLIIISFKVFFFTIFPALESYTDNRKS